MATRTPNFGWPVPENPDPATIPKDILSLAVPIDAVVQQLADRIEAREQFFTYHAGEGAWELTNGLGEPVTVANPAEGDWQVMA